MILRPYCPGCRRPMHPVEVMLAKYPRCGAFLDVVLVDAIERGRALEGERREKEAWR